MIRARGLRCGYGRGDVLRGLELRVRPGEMLGVLGPNGGGKTTLVLTLSGVLAPSEGRVELGGDELAALPHRERARRVAVVPQRPEGLAEMWVYSVVLMGRYPHTGTFGGYDDADHDAVREALRRTATEQFADRPAGSLSGGELQRVLLARALAQDAPLLLLDEIAAGLDTARKVELHDLLRAENAAGRTVVSVVHDLNLAALYFPRLVFLKEGRVALDGPTREVFTATNLSRIYDAPITVAPHPVTGDPQAFMVPGIFTPAAGVPGGDRTAGPGRH